ncbi:MAG: PHP domain-containing protein, partial [Candidatus Dormibacteria bacterium]
MTTARRREPGDPEKALRRIAYLLEAQGAESFKVKAFRRAAAAIAGVTDQELRRLVAEVQLRTLAGVGESTARAIEETLGEGTPSYLKALEATKPLPLSDAAAALRGRLRGDCHCHSDWSDGGSPIGEMAQAALEL